jgi:2-(1,2-epoxy-1,2-dihydrophenyl)acetyl-CoA isomerase
VGWSAPVIRYDPAGACATLTLDAPATKNALGPTDWRALADGVARAAADPAVRVVVLVGAGSCFSAGGDLSTMPERLAMPIAERRAQLVSDGQVIVALRELAKPVLAVIDGPAMGAGLSLALACDLRLASTRARFGASFHRVGLTCDFGMSHLLPEIVGVARALELTLLAEPIDAKAALAMGLVHEVVPDADLAARAKVLADKLAALAPLAAAASKRALQGSARLGLAGAIEAEAATQAMLGKTADAAEGVRAFAEKRPPKFEGR